MPSPGFEPRVGEARLNSATSGTLERTGLGELETTSRTRQLGHWLGLHLGGGPLFQPSAMTEYHVEAGVECDLSFFQLEEMLLGYGLAYGRWTQRVLDAASEPRLRDNAGNPIGPSVYTSEHVSFFDSYLRFGYRWLLTPSSSLVSWFGYHTPVTWFAGVSPIPTGSILGRIEYRVQNVGVFASVRRGLYGRRGFEPARRATYTVGAMLSWGIL